MGITKCDFTGQVRTYISRCQEIELLRLTKFDHVRDDAVDPSSPNTLDLGYLLVKTRRISIHPFKSYNGNRQTDRQTGGTDIRIKCS